MTPSDSPAAAALLDHLVLATADLAQGRRWLQDRLGVELQDGGEHHLFGTHNALVGLGNAYLELIAINPQAPAPERPRWFELDTPEMQARLAQEPQLIHWVVGVPDLWTALRQIPEALGEVTPLSRGMNRWLLSVPRDGSLPFGGVMPSLIEWESLAPTARLEDRGVRLSCLQLSTPDPERLTRALDPLRLEGVPLEVEAGPTRLRATLQTPGGVVVL
ncbi:VOC family protein [Deinococcus sonorensis]|uniref:VOC family protein n=2 Tax=Deinococcus sonorensis TaxID=309891 RepID=A0AAU7UAW1_9DEIO